MTDTLPAILERLADREPERMLLRGDDSVSARELVDRVRRCAAGIAVLDSPDAPIAVRMEASIDGVTALVAAAWCGRRVFPHEGSSPTIREQARSVGVRTFVGGRGDAPDSLPISDLLRSSEPAPPLCDDPLAPFVLHRTSGTTGPPKFAIHSQRSMIRGGRIYQETFDLVERDSILLCVPLAHSFGMVGGLCSALVSGAELRLSGRFVPSSFWREVAEGVTVILGVPTLYEFLARVPRRGDPSSVRLCLSSGGPLSETTARLAGDALGTPIRPLYGCTEAGAIAAEVELDEPSAGTVGRLLPGVEARIVGPDGASAFGEGELEVRTTTLFLGYAGVPGSTPHNGWYATGDVARIDVDGRVRLLGRKGTFINVGGRKVNPADVEAALREHPSVLAAHIRAVPCDIGGQAVHARVELRAAATEAEFRRHCRARLAAHEVPATIEITESLRRVADRKLPHGSEDPHND